MKRKKNARPKAPRAQGPWSDLALHTLGWKAFQDLCAHVADEILKRPVEVYREAQDGGQDAVFIQRRSKGKLDWVPATIQCKFSSVANRTLKPGDLLEEEAKIVELKAKGQAETYILMSSMSVGAPAAIEIKNRLRSLGVVHPHVFGREFLTKAIRASAKLRALVPRVYGLGDLSTILDERRAAQTNALLGHMLPTLKVYVPTAPHVKAVKSLANHGIVLLLGDPATGKSTIAAILSTIALEKAENRTFKADGPEDLLQNWNPHEPTGFYWIDDAFGPNQMREDYVDRWIAIMPKVQAAIAGGNKFVLTSRRHIYEAAKPKLGSKNLPLFRDEEAIVNVGALTAQERRQILYNHIKAGSQPKTWKSSVKKLLDPLANEELFLPEIARRLADPSYTRRLPLVLTSLLKFLREPKEHLIQTIRELSKLHRAALTLVFLHHGRMPVRSPSPAMLQLIERYFSIDPETLGNSIGELRDSFLVEKDDGPKHVWSFKHPTISDALGAILGGTDGMAELYLRGVKSNTIITEVVCDGADPIEDAVVVPAALDGLLIERVTEVPDNASDNSLLFAFMARRASDKVFQELVQRDPSILLRKTYVYQSLGYDRKIRVHARAFRFGLLSEELRDETAVRLESSIIDDRDVSFLDDELILSLLRPMQLIALPLRIRDETLPGIPTVADEIASEADLDYEAEETFEALTESLHAFEKLLESDAAAVDALNLAQVGIEKAIKDVQDAQRDRERHQRDEWDWEDQYESIARYKARAERSELAQRVLEQASERPLRSIFSDVDD